MAFGRSVVRFHPDTQRIFIATRGRHRAAFGETRETREMRGIACCPPSGTEGTMVRDVGGGGAREWMFSDEDARDGGGDGGDARERDDDGDDRARER